MNVYLIQERYEIKRLLGEGGSAQVFQVFDHRLSCTQAMKRIPKNSSSYARDSFDREIQLMAQLHHASIPKILNSFEDTHYAYAIMELIEGIPLLDFVKEERKISQKCIIEWMLQVISVFLYLHSLHPTPLLYLDLKPQNIMIDPTGRLHLIDFGSSCFIDHLKVRSATPHYAPKELIQDHNPCFQSDIYSFGETFYVLTHGHFPKPHTRLDALDKVLLKCCEEEITKRYTNFAMVKKDTLKLRIKSTRQFLKLLLLESLCFLFLFLGIQGQQQETRSSNQKYTAYMRQGNYPKALEIKPDEVEPYQNYYETKCDYNKPQTCEKALYRIEELTIQYKQQANPKIAFFLALNFFLQDKISSYQKAQFYLQKSHRNDPLAKELLALSKLLQKERLNKRNIKELSALLNQITSASNTLKNKKERFAYQKIVGMLYECYHNEIKGSEDKLLALCEESISMMKKAPKQFTRLEKNYIEDQQALAFYYKGTKAFELEEYDQMMKYYDQAITAMKKSTLENRYSTLVDMELACFEYGIKEEEKKNHLDRLTSASKFVEEIKQSEDKQYFKNRITQEYRYWRD